MSVTTVKAVHVGIWMGDLSMAAYEHERTPRFKTFVKEHIDAMLGVITPFGDMAALLGDTFEEHEDEKELRTQLSAALVAASKTTRRVLVHEDDRMLAATCFPNPDGEGWIKARAFPLTLDLGAGYEPWDCDEVVTRYIGELKPATPLPNAVRRSLEALRLHVIVVWAHQHALK